MTHPLETVKAALEYAGTLIKFCVKPEKCVTRGDIKAGKDNPKSALEIYGEIQKAISTLTTYMGQTQSCTECERLTRENAALREALKPFARYACSPPGECECHNCKAATIIKQIEGE